jgi:RNA polymerase-binding transcription factor DksA
MAMHLTPDEMKELRNELQLELERLGGRYGSMDADRGPLTADAARAAGAPERLLRNLDALSRMRSGRYGSCVGCRTAIPFARLAAIPETTTCVACSEAWMPVAR